MVKKALSKLGGELSEEEFFLSDESGAGNSDWFSENGTTGELAVDVYETANDMVLKAPVAGVAPEDIEITAKPDMVTISGERKEEREVANENYVSRECFWGSFSRSVALPAEGEVDKAKVTFKNGILSIRIPKSKKNQSVKLKINN
jgi:HSP20 family protein